MKYTKSSKERAVNGGNDAYYTNPEYALRCCKIIKKKFYRFKIKNIVEPSAGDGSFYEGIKLLCKNNKRSFYMYDIIPKAPYIKQKNFFDVKIDKDTLILGNPPFGFASNLAIKFFNHAAKQKAKLIAFILPKTFRKDSVKNKLNLNYKLVYEEECPSNVFILNGKPYNVPCVFQVWVYSIIKRKIENWSVDNKWIEYTSKNNADFCLRRVGGRAGQILEGFPSKYSEASTYFCKEKIKGAKEALKNIDFKHIVNSTAGVRSLSKKEIHKALHNYYKE